tara:strand:+ start:7386 stop:7913 length:528 start_codon:yes stop_codon:yes gene_type:complete
MKHFISLVMVSLVTTACSTLGSNVSGDWSCETGTTNVQTSGQKGGCPTTHEIDERVLAEIKGEHPRHAISLDRLPELKITAVASFDDGMSEMRDDERPGRTPDRIGRIVIMPFVDAKGSYHGRAVVHAVMEEGIWDVPPKKPVLKKPMFKKPVFSKPIFEKPVPAKPVFNKNSKK